MKVNRKELIACLKPMVSMGNLYFDGHVVRSGSLNFQIESPLPGGLNLTCVVPGKPILDMLKEMPEDEVEIANRRSKLYFACGGVKVDFKLLKDEVPLIRIPLPEDSIEVENLEELVEGLRSASVCASKDEADGPLCGVRAIGSKLYACDKFRIFRYSLNEGIVIEGSIPLSFIKMLSGLKVKGGKLYGGTRISFQGEDGIVVTSSLLAGDYPDLARMFPDSDPVVISFGGNQISAVLAKHCRYQSKVDIGEQELEVMLHGNECTIVSNSELGILQETLEMETNIGDKEIGFFANPVLFDGVEKKCTACEFYPENGIVMFVSGSSEYLIRTKE